MKKFILALFCLIVVSKIVQAAPVINSFTATPNPICQGDSSTLQVDFTFNTSATLTWSDGFVQTGVTSSPQFHVVTPGSTTVYFVTIVDKTGSTTSPNLTVTVNDPPVVNLSVDQSTITQGQSATLTVTITGSGPYDLVWSDGFIQSGVSSPVTRTVSPTTTTTYFVGVTDANNCTTTSNDVTITVNPQPFILSLISAAIIAKYCPI